MTYYNGEKVDARSLRKMPQEIQTRIIEQEMKEKYVDYAMSVIMARALPDVRDGLKPVHRRILYAMHRLGLTHAKPFRKSAFIIGRVMASYHPHGDAAIYDALVRMAQDFSLRYPLIEGQGNFGSIDGDSPAATRYTEARLAKLSDEMLLDIEKETVEFVPNYDNSTKEPIVLPSKLPNLLINGSSGIAVGMATNMPPHNVSEVCSALIAMIENPQISPTELLHFIKGPDFPTAAIISGTRGIREAYETGRGKIVIKSKTEIKDNKIIVTEIPYMVNKAVLIESTAGLVKEGIIENITDIRDESSRKGIRIILELKKNADPNLTLNQLYAHTALRTTFGIIMLATHNNEPVIMNLRTLLQHHIDHRKNVITNRTRFDLRKAEERHHVVLGLIIALDNIDPVIQMIKTAADVDTARTALMQNYQLSEIQASAILDMKLQKLTSLETQKLKDERADLEKTIEDLKSILADEKKIFDIIKKDILELREKYGDQRRTIIQEAEEEIETEESLIQENDVVITITHSGYIKQVPLTTYKQQKRAGYGIIGAETKEQDVVDKIFVTSNMNYLLFFTNKGRVFWLKAYKVPEGSRYSRGKAVVNLLKLAKDEKVSTVYPVQQFGIQGEIQGVAQGETQGAAQQFLIMATRKGIIKKTKLADYSKPRQAGLRAIKLRENDSLVHVSLTQGTASLVIATKNGRAVHFNEHDVRPMGRNAAGVRGIKLGKDDEVIGMETVNENSTLLTVTEKGLGKRTKIQDYRLTRRGSKGVTNIALKPESGKVVAIKTVTGDDEVILMSEKGVVIRVKAKDLPVLGRATKGVIIMRLKDNDRVTTVAKVEKE